MTESTITPRNDKDFYCVISTAAQRSGEIFLNYNSVIQYNTVATVFFTKQEAILRLEYRLLPLGVDRIEKSLITKFLFGGVPNFDGITVVCSAKPLCSPTATICSDCTRTAFDKFELLDVGYIIVGMI